MSASVTTRTPWGTAHIAAIGRSVIDVVSLAGDIAIFALDMLRWLVLRFPRPGVLLPVCYAIGVQSLPVVMLTGAFIGLVIAVQTYDTLRVMHFETQLGITINSTLVKELGPVLTAVMLAGRVGGAMSAEIGTMKITEQIDALRVLGANPMQYLVVPRFIACVLLIPMLALFADVAGVFSGWVIGTQVMGVDSSHYWVHSERFVSSYDLFTGAAKCLFFGAAISLIACHRGFHCQAGAEGVGKAATEAFVTAFISILALDFLLGIVINEGWYLLRAAGFLNPI